MDPVEDLGGVHRVIGLQSGPLLVSGPNTVHRESFGSPYPDFKAHRTKYTEES